MDIDIKRLRKDLLDYFGAAMYMVSPYAMADVIRIQNASDEELLSIAKENKFDLDKYKKPSKDDRYYR